MQSKKTKDFVLCFLLMFVRLLTLEEPTLKKERLIFCVKN